MRLLVLVEEKEIHAKFSLVYHVGILGYFRTFAVGDAAQLDKSVLNFCKPAIEILNKLNKFHFFFQ